MGGGLSFDFTNPSLMIRNGGQSKSHEQSSGKQLQIIHPPGVVSRYHDTAVSVCFRALHEPPSPLATIKAASATYLRYLVKDGEI